jgi:hypothetical protein
VLIDYVQRDYRTTIATIENLTSHGEITFDLLYALMPPRTIIVATCPLTNELQAFRLLSGTIVSGPMGTSMYVLVCEGMGLDDVKDPSAQTFAKIQTRVIIPEFEGVQKISSLDAYPIQYHPGEAELRQSLIVRGRKWAQFNGIHHVSYKGMGGYRTKEKIIKYNVSYP